MEPSVVECRALDFDEVIFSVVIYLLSRVVHSEVEHLFSVRVAECLHPVVVDQAFAEGIAVELAILNLDGSSSVLTIVSEISGIGPTGRTSVLSIVAEIVCLNLDQSIKLIDQKFVR